MTCCDCNFDAEIDHLLVQAGWKSVSNFAGVAWAVASDVAIFSQQTGLHDIMIYHMIIQHYTVHTGYIT